MTAADTIARLDAALARSGATVKVFRGAAFVECRAKIKALTAEDLRAGSLSAQGNYRAILSPTAFTAAGAAVALPLKVTDKVLFNGAQRTITAPPLPIIHGSDVVRIEIDFMG
jgi:hypothetical protein